MLFSNWNDSFEMKQFGMNQYLFPNAKMWFCSKCQNMSSLQFKIWTGRTFCFTLYTHTYSISKTFYTFHPKAGWKQKAKILENWDAENDILQFLQLSNTNEIWIFFPVKLELREWKVHHLSSAKPKTYRFFSFPVSKWSQRHLSSK